MKQIIGKKDILLVIIIVIAAIAIWCGYRGMHQGTGGRVQVTVDGECIGEYDLSEDQEIPIEQNGQITNTLIIEDGEADMISADCPDKLCVNQKNISHMGETIVCLPNKVVVEVTASDDTADLDTIAK